ncbi:MAG: DUF1318 domain-containing protein [Candidatus Abyssobacteria bacterium SURF_17]|uniref:DUF1318 domain-containing protein n=1 Tax=Candidatus Abyssobacteria bacterium SURF_17 TaxID=2093361 RepID=A0A419F9I8_9BACT|nr:MAG: DUF1318 domain-containing protein [Candidatus Abyssubacteria bacterium SURF_17]
MKKSILLATVLALLFTLACVTVNVYFPAAEVQRAADKIVEEVQGTQPTTSEAPSDESMLRRSWNAIALFQNEAYAQPDINITTPNIRALKAKMKERFPSLQPLYGNGVVGETNDGLLNIRSLEGLGLKEKADAKKLVEAENADRENLYREIAKANDLTPDTIPQIKELFANSWRKNAKKGWWIQEDDGEWVKKVSE